MTVCVTECFDGFYDNGAGVCVTCLTAGQFGVCVLINGTWVLDGQDCSDNCKTCGTEIDDCTSCPLLSVLAIKDETANTKKCIP